MSRHAGPVRRAAAPVATLGGLAVLALCLAAPGCAGPEEPVALTAESVLARHLEAHGGAAHVDALKSMKISGTYDAFSTPGPMEIVRARPDLFRFDFTLFGAPATLAYDGTRAWVRGAAYDAAEAAEITDKWRRNVLSDAPFGCPLLAHAADGSRIEYVGAATVEGTPVQTLRVVPAAGPEETWHLDAATFLENERISRTFDVFSGPDAEMEMDTFYMDFRDVGGVQVPFREERHFGTRYHVYEAETIEANPAVDAGTFAMPAAAP